MNRVRAGDILPSYEVAAVNAEKMKTMSALMRDANPIHFDSETVQALGMGDRVVNQGPLNQAYVLSMLGLWAGGLDRVRRIRLRYRGNVFAGDRVRAGGTVTAVHDATDGRVAKCDVRLEVVARAGTADPATVLTGTATVHLGDRTLDEQ